MAEERHGAEGGPAGGPRRGPPASGCLNLTLTAVGRGAAGSYRCRVLTELPAYGVLEGPGTVVRVQGPPGPPAGEQPSWFLRGSCWFLTRALLLPGPAPRGGVAPPLLGLVLRSLPLLALILAFVCLRRSRSPAAAPCEEGGGL
ncbi:unnamed protein product [Tetraodon nigroviridis]|uniref:(spotted green pufferfish) hypothetical protein n=1 Tax=Tetraodon nigroviridis TaxID=99883 RepID=Q4TBN4_TETNG|nr:unnamed protein product [Tetraodon nigroviridis]